MLEPRVTSSGSVIPVRWNRLHYSLCLSKNPHVSDALSWSCLFPGTQCWLHTLILHWALLFPLMGSTWDSNPAEGNKGWPMTCTVSDKPRQRTQIVIYLNYCLGKTGLYPLSVSRITFSTAERCELFFGCSKREEWSPSGGFTCPQMCSSSWVWQMGRWSRRWWFHAQRVPACSLEAPLHLWGHWGWVAQAPHPARLSGADELTLTPKRQPRSSCSQQRWVKKSSQYIHQASIWGRIQLPRASK